ncbi:V-set and immunoglobulin domain-containing protein 1 [Nothobranchius furzeri]|uniref:LOC107372328-like protein n=2 Tax=Nothobranchius furzeri TaxID=105023 RepID=A0A8C6LYS1_NOTFU|nr:immunoglobulin kappa light chain-like [Nothobranchius furzeri]KAF7208980.1 putative LOC107372328-like protein [Nothobranchius furzeri]
MTPSKPFFYLMGVLLWNLAETNDVEPIVRRDSPGFLTSHIGGDVTLSCTHQSVAVRYYWYKQTLGQKLKLVSISYKYDESGTFYDDFKDNPHFKLKTEHGKSQLQISDLRLSDTGTYFCASGLSFMFEFGEGATVIVKDSGLENTALVLQPASETVQSGDSVTLNCSVHTGTCDGEHSVYWFKDSEDSHPGLIYSHGGRNDQCEREPNTLTHTCVYNLPLKNLNVSDAGIYYCAVASCGHILFGNGTKLEMTSEVYLVYLLSGVLIFTITLSALLAVVLYKLQQKGLSRTSEFQIRFASQQTTNEEHGNQNTDNLHYAAVGVNTRSTSRRMSSHTQCVYSSVKQ